MLKNIYFVSRAYCGDAKNFQLIERLTQLCHKRGLIVVPILEEAQLVIVLAENLEPNEAYKGKKVFVVEPALAFNDPEGTLEKALKENKPYEN